MSSCVNEDILVDLDKHFKFNDEVNFGSVSHGGCKCLDKDFLSYYKNKAIKDGYYILGISSNDSQGYSSVIDVDIDNDSHKWHECVYIIGEYKNGHMRELITGKKIKYVDEVDVIHFCAPRSLIRYSNNTWQEYPEISGEEFEPRYYFADLCYVTCNEISKLDVLKYLEYFMYSSQKFCDNYKDKIISTQDQLKKDYIRILNAYNRDLSQDYKKKRLLNYNK